MHAQLLLLGMCMRLMPQKVNYKEQYSGILTGQAICVLTKSEDSTQVDKVPSTLHVGYDSSFGKACGGSAG